MKVFVGNLSVKITEDDLRHAFESFGQVRSVTIVMDEATSKSRGFGFVIMPSPSEAKNAIREMNNKDLKGQKINVEKARAKRKAHDSRLRQGGFGSGGRANRVRRVDSGGSRGRHGY